MSRAGLWSELMYTFPNSFPIFCYWWETQEGCMSHGVRSRRHMSPCRPVCSCSGVSDVMYTTWWSRAPTHLGERPVFVALWDKDGLRWELGLLQSLAPLHKALWLAWIWNKIAGLRNLYISEKYWYKNCYLLMLSNVIYIDIYINVWNTLTQDNLKSSPT